MRTARPARAAADSGTARRKRPVIRRIMPRRVLPLPRRVDGVLRAAVFLGRARAVERAGLGFVEDGLGQGAGVVDAGGPLLGGQFPGPFGDEVGRWG